MQAPKDLSPHDLELWGGVEPTVNRVGDRWFDQIRRSGHEDRLSDIARFAALGLKAMRYPVLWERSLDRTGGFHFGWAEERLRALRAHGVRPIVGLVHHGSGPAGVDLLDPGFAPGLARFAAAAVRRFPWIRDWTPVNEPLTTARFSAVYGLWWPHRRDEGDGWRALLNQIDAVRLAMAAIREVNPKARLIQTDDLGCARATPTLADQAAFENERRWLGWDLLFGRVRPGHPLYARIADFGLADRLDAIAADPTPPDVVGVNYYLTSERFLDDRLERYPDAPVGGDGVRAYVDLEAVRVCADGLVGLEALLELAWRRYRTPLAVTECHNGCTREEQLRWLEEAWSSARALRARGVDVQAVTAWSLLGAFDWDCLLTRDAGRYEPGVFDLRGGAPRPTALAGLIKDLTTLGEPSPERTVEGLGWWRRDGARLTFPAATRTVGAELERALRRPRATAVRQRPILVTGGTGTLGQAFLRACRERDLLAVATTRRRLDLTSEASVREALDALSPRMVINAAGFVRVDAAEAEAEACHGANAQGVAVLAAACAHRNLPMATFSSDLVFDGAKGAPYLEGDPPAPLNVYGRSKADAEALALTAHPGALVVRTAAFFSAHDPHNFAVHALAALESGQTFAASDSHRISPTHTPDLVRATLDLMIDGEEGLIHLVNQGGLSWAGFAHLLADRAGLDPELVVDAGPRTLGWRAPRPRDVTLASERGNFLSELDEAVERFLHGWRSDCGRAAASAVTLRAAAAD